MKFWDSSAIVPLFVEEKSSAAMRKLLREDQTAVVWWASVIEVHSAISRLVRDGHLKRSELRPCLDRLNGFRRTWAEVAPSEEILLEAERLLFLHPLRAGDALQLAALICCANRRASLLEFVCLDERLADAAEKEGYVVRRD